jgi:hypothetical protein
MIEASQSKTVRLYGARVHVADGIVWQTVDSDPLERDRWLQRMGLFFTPDKDDSGYYPTTKFERFTLEIVEPS